MHIKKTAYLIVNMLSVLVFWPLSSIRNTIRTDGNLRILVYHSVYSKRPEGQKAEWTVDPEVFESQMRILKNTSPGRESRHVRI